MILSKAEKKASTETLEGVAAGRIQWARKCHDSFKDFAAK